MSGANHAFHGLLHAGQGIGVLGSGIQVTEVNTKLEWPIQPSSISWMCWCTLFTKGRAMRQNHSLNSSSFNNSMMCSVASVHPISFSSKEKMWWNSSSSATAFCANSGGQSLRWSNLPSFFRVAGRSSCLCDTISLTGSGTLGSSLSSFFNKSGAYWASGTALVAMTRPITHPLARCKGQAVKFRRTTMTFQLPSLSSERAPGSIHSGSGPSSWCSVFYHGRQQTGNLVLYNCQSAGLSHPSQWDLMQC